MRVKYRTRIIVCFLLVIILNFGCTKFVTVSPPRSQLVSSVVFSDDPTAISAVLGIYVRMVTNYGFASGNNTSVTFLSGLSADELNNYSSSPAQIEFYRNALTSTNSNIKSFSWGDLYQYIYTTNSIIDGIASSKTMTTAVSSELTGEAKFVRAFCYFYLVNLYGDVPLVTETNYKSNALKPRSAVIDMYVQILADLKDAANLLSTDYLSADGITITNDRVRPTKWAAYALLSRVYLFTGNWPQAEALADSVIGNTSLYNLVNDLNNVFLANSTEAIWQLMPVQPALNTWEGYNFILTSVPYNVSLSDDLLNSFEPGDLRKINWVSDFTNDSITYYHFPYKYKVQLGTVKSEFSMVLRLAEQFLIRSEARAEQNEYSGAQQDLNIIRNRAGLNNVTTSNKDSLLSYILHERQVELFTEWGHRWFDLKRSGMSDAVLGAEKPGWKSTDSLYPIPISDILADGNLKQNAGY